MSPTARDYLLGERLAITRHHRLAVFFPALDYVQHLTAAITLAIVEHHVAMAKVTRHGNRVTAEMARGSLHSFAPEHAEKRLMHEIRMVPVHRIFDLQLPISAITIFMYAAACVDFAH